jgi:regulator of protease activity HflC (stomatin/prohibitin superfamily)
MSNLIKNSKIIFLFVTLVAAFQVAISFFLDIVKVDATETAIVTNRGQVSQVLSAGWHFKTPYLTKHAATYNITTQSISVVLDSASKDQQSVEIKANLQYRLKPDKIKDIYLSIGGNGNGGAFADQKIENLIGPIFQESVKSASARYTAVELLSKREMVKQDAIDQISKSLERYHVDVITVNIENISFSEDFNRSIEAKVVAQQRAEQAKFELEQEKANLEKEIVKARGVKARGEALRANPEVLEEQKIQKWDGKLPQVQGSEGLIIDIR